MTVSIKPNYHPRWFGTKPNQFYEAIYLNVDHYTAMLWFLVELCGSFELSDIPVITCVECGPPNGPHWPGIRKRQFVKVTKEEFDTYRGRRS